MVYRQIIAKQQFITYAQLPIRAFLVALIPIADNSHRTENTVESARQCANGRLTRPVALVRVKEE